MLVHTSCTSLYCKTAIVASSMFYVNQLYVEGRCDIEIDSENCEYIRKQGKGMHVL